MLSLWLVMTIGWCFALTYVGDDSVPIHWIIGMIAGASTFEHMISTIRYLAMNSENTDPIGLFILAALAQVIVATAGRLIILATALGYHIRESSIDIYLDKIALMGFFYVISLGLETLVVNFLAHDYQLQHSTIIMSSAPRLVCDLILLMWILMAFRRTIAALIRAKEGNKTLVVTQLFVLYIGSIFIIVCLKVAALAY